MSDAEAQKREYFRRLYTDPVKHFVRVYGWLPAAEKRLHRILSERRSRRFATYFTFPGEYAIDVLLFAEKGIIEETGVGFPSVVYCESRPGVLSEINRRLGKCKGVFPYPFERAVFMRDFASFCPFDIINLDLTKEIFPRNGRPESNAIRAIQQLLWLHENRNFDLYITFKSSLRETNPHAIKDFKRLTNDNFTNNVKLKDAFVKSCGMESDELLDSDFTLFWCKSFPKWILEQGLTKNVVGSLIGEFCYARQPQYGEPYDIVTFLFSFERPRRHYMSEHQMFAKTQSEILRSFSLTPIRVNEILLADAEKRDELGEDVERILQKPPKMAS
jgi:hypothetical protein